MKQGCLAWGKEKCAQWNPTSRLAGHQRSFLLGFGYLMLTLGFESLSQGVLAQGVKSHLIPKVLDTISACS